MGFEIKRGGNFTLCPAGSFVARCYMVVDMGMQPVVYMGKKSNPRQKIRIGFEFPDQLHVFDEKKGEEPFTLSRSFTNSLNEKASLRPVLNSWRGRPLTDEDIAGGVIDAKTKKPKPPFTFKTLLGVPAFITVIHETRKTDNSKIAKISNIAKLPAKIGGVDLVCPPAVLPPILYSVDEGPDSPTFKRLPTWIQEECRQCLEWNEAPEDEGQQVASRGGDDGSDDGGPPDSDTPF